MGVRAEKMCGDFAVPSRSLLFFYKISTIKTVHVAYRCVLTLKTNCIFKLIFIMDQLRTNIYIFTTRMVIAIFHAEEIV